MQICKRGWIPIQMQAHSVKRDQMTLASECVKVLNGAIWKFDVFEAPLLPKLQPHQGASYSGYLGIALCPGRASQDEPSKTLRGKRDCSLRSGDIHQPLHTANGFFNDTNRGYLPNGDRGGNRLGVPMLQRAHFICERKAVCYSNLQWWSEFLQSRLGKRPVRWICTSESSAIKTTVVTKCSTTAKSEFMLPEDDCSGRYHVAMWIVGVWDHLQDPSAESLRCQQPAFLLGFSSLWVPFELVTGICSTLKALGHWDGRWEKPI